MIDCENKLNNAETFTAIFTAARISKRFCLYTVVLTLNAPVSSLKIEIK